MKRIVGNVCLEQLCEAVAADPASLHYAVTRRAKAGLSRHSPQDDGGTKRTAGQQPADALKKFSAGGGSRAVSREVRRCNRLTAGAVIEGKYQQKLRATGNWKRGESGGEKAGTAVSLRLASLCAVKSVALPIGYTSDSACQ